MRKIAFLLSFALLIGLMIPSIHATSEISDICQEFSTIHTESGDYEIEITTVIYNSATRSNSRSAAKEGEIKYNGKVLARVTLSATFGYDGKTAWVSNASGSHTTYDGWSYLGENISKSGGTATLTAALFKVTEGTVPVNISMTCSPTGQIS